MEGMNPDALTFRRIKPPQHPPDLYDPSRPATLG